MLTLVKNAHRMMTSANLTLEGIDVTFADGLRGRVPLREVRGVRDPGDIISLEMPNPYEIVLVLHGDETVELPWDFVRHYCDKGYVTQAQEVTATGRRAIGERIRLLREAKGLAQSKLAQTAGIGRVTLVRTERGEQSPRYDTLMALAKALGISLSELTSV